ncbi:MAG: flippase [Patescibacteria group bacterium]
MSLTGQVGRNTLIQVLGKMLGTALGLVVVGLLTRYLGTQGYGQYTTVIAYLGFFSVIADLGLYLIVLREISKKDAQPEKVLGNVFSLRVIFAVLILGIGAVLAFFLNYPSIVKWAILLGVVNFVFVALTGVLTGIFQKFLKMYKVIFGEILGRIVLLVFTLIFIGLKLNLIFIILSVILGSGANFILVYRMAVKYVPIRFLFDFAYWKYILKETWPLAISVILNLIYFKIDTVILSLMKPAADVGLYGASYKVLEVLVTLPNMFVGLILPLLTYYAFSNQEKFTEIFRRAFDFLVLVTVPLVAGGFILAKPLILLIGGQDFAKAAPIFQILIFAVGCLFLGSLSGHAIVAINKQRKMVWGYLTVAVLGLGLYFILIPLFSYIGAAIGTVITEFTIAAIGYYIILKTMKFKLPYKIFIKSLVASLVMVGFLYAAKDFNIIIQLVVGAVIYLGVSYVLKSFSKDEVLSIIKIREEEKEHVG